MLIFLICLGAVAWIALLENRVTRLEKAYTLLEGSRREHMSTEKWVGGEESLVEANTGLKIPTPPKNIRAIPTDENMSGGFFEWMKDEWLLKLGALLMLIGLGWFVTYAFMNNWIGATGRITLGLAVGLIFLVFGWFRMQKHEQQGSVFLIVGSTTILLTIFSARAVYGFFTPFTALAIMFLSVVFVALASVYFSRLPLALASLIFAGITPLLIHSEFNNYIGLFSYLLVVVIGTVWVIALRQWRELSFVGLLIVFFYSLPHIVGLVDRGESIALLPFAYVFSWIFFAVNTRGIFSFDSTLSRADVVTALGNGLFSLAWIVALVEPDGLQAIFLSLWSIAFLFGAFFIFRVTGKRTPFFVYSGVGVVLLGTALAVLLEGATLVIAYTLACSALVVVSAAVLEDKASVNVLKFTFIVPCLVSLGNMDPWLWRKSIFQEHFFALLVLALALMFVGYFLKKRLVGGIELMILGSLYIFRIIWLSLGAVFYTQQDIAVVLALIIYTLIGMIFYFYGRLEDKRIARLYGASCLGFVIARLFLVDIWEMEMEQRIISCVVVGLLLMSTAFFGKKSKQEQEN